MDLMNLSIQTFATVPAGVAIVWAIMAIIDSAIPTLTTQIKVLLQLVVSLLYAAIAAGIFIEGTPKEVAQKGVILFCMVAFSQTAIYENFQKLSGNKGTSTTNNAAKPFTDYGNQGGGDNGRI